MLLNRQIKAVLIYRYNYVVFLLFLMTGLNRLLISGEIKFYFIHLAFPPIILFKAVETSESVSVSLIIVYCLSFNSLNV